MDSVECRHPSTLRKLGTGSAVPYPLDLLLSPSNDVGMSGIDFAMNFFPPRPRRGVKEGSRALRGGRPELTTLPSGQMVSLRGVSDLNEEVPTSIFLLFAVMVAKFHVFSIVSHSPIECAVRVRFRSAAENHPTEPRYYREETVNVLPRPIPWPP